LKGKNLYKLYQLFFGYESLSSEKQRKNYAMSIAEAVKILEEAYEKKSSKPIDDYLAKPKKRQLTANFLNNFSMLIDQEFTSPFKQVKYIASQIAVSKEHLFNKRKDIIFACPYIEDNKNNRIIILTFSSPKNMQGEVSVLKGLIHAFKIDRPFSNNIKNISYWDLSKGDIIEEDYTAAIPILKEKLIEVLKRF
jgi:hypothetical protein